MHGVIVDLMDDAEGYVPLEIDYLPKSAERHRELASQFPTRPAALARGRRLAALLKLTYIAHHL